MADTYSQIYLHVVFAVQWRENLIAPAWKEELYKYITGIVKSHGQKLIAINGMPDHIHILLGVKPDIMPSKLIQEIKANSSRFVNSKKLVKGKFYWQEGFGVFSYARSQVDVVTKYIQNQEKHHAEQDFKAEYVSLLKKFEVEFEEKYLFDWEE